VPDGLEHLPSEPVESCAGTPFVEFDGDLAKVDYLKYDVANFVHHLRPGSSHCIVGTGGGRDVLTGLLFGKERIDGVEVNEDILDLANNRFGDFTGHLDRHPRELKARGPLLGTAENSGASPPVLAASSSTGSCGWTP
jgi:hypothetical protein